MAIPSTQQHYSLRWNNYLRHITFAFDFLRNSNDLVDVTLCCDGKKIKAHKVLLSACSGYFKEIFKDNPHPHPIIIFKFIKFEDLNAIMEFIYHGRVNVQQDALQSFLQTAELLAVHGLTSEDKNNSKIQIPKIEEYLSQPNPSCTTRPSTTDSITQTTNIDFIKSNKLTKKRKITFTDDEDEVENSFNETISFTKNEPNTEMQFIPATIKLHIPEYLNVSNPNQHQIEQTQIIKHDDEQINETNDELRAIDTQCKSEYDILENSKVINEKYQNQENSETEQNTNRIETTECTYGRYSTQTDEELANTSMQIEPTDLICKVCNRQLQSISAYRRHNASKHGQKLEKYNCTSCDKSFKTKWSLSTHNSRFHRNKEKEIIKMSFSI